MIHIPENLLEKYNMADIYNDIEGMEPADQNMYVCQSWLISTDSVPLDIIEGLIMSVHNSPDPNTAIVGYVHDTFGRYQDVLSLRQEAKNILNEYNGG